MTLYLTPKGKRVLPLLLLVVILAILLAVLYYMKTNEFKIVNNPQKAKEVALSLKEEVGRIYVLPPDDPIVATVTDTSILPSGEFYEKAQNGDKILIFELSKKIILYRPGVGKVVDVGTLESPTPDNGLEKIENEATESSTIKTVPRILIEEQ